MSQLLCALVVSLGTICFATAADARRGSATGMAEFLEFLTDLAPVPGETDAPPMSVCHLIERHTVFMFPMYYVSKGYVLSDAKCATDSYIPMTLDEFLLGQIAGFIPASLPVTPRLSFKQAATPYFIGSFVGLLVLLTMFQRIRDYRDRRAHAAQGMHIGNQITKRNADVYCDHYSLMLVEVLCQLVRQGYVLRDQDKTRIATIAMQFLGAGFDEAQVRRMISNAKVNLTLSQFREFVPELSPPQRERIMQAALLAAGDANATTLEKRSLISGLAGLLSISAPQIDTFGGPIQPIPA